MTSTRLRNCLFESLLHLFSDRVCPGGGECRIGGDMDIDEYLTRFVPVPEVVVPCDPGVSITTARMSIGSQGRFIALMRISAAS